MQVINNLILLHHFNERLEKQPWLKDPCSRDNVVAFLWTKHERRFTGNSVSDVQLVFQLRITYNILQIESVL